MANATVNKVVLGNETLIDISDTTATAADVSQGAYFYLASGEKVEGASTGGTMVIRDSQDSHGGTVREITAGTVVTGTKSITANGTYDVAAYADAQVNVPSVEPSLQAKTATPSESQQTVTPDSGYDGLSSVTVGAISSTYVGSEVPRVSGGTLAPTETSNLVVAAGEYATGDVYVSAISSTYVGSGITRRSSSSLTASGATVTVPAGYYASQASKAVSSGTAGTPTATKGTVSNHSVSVTPSVTNTTGYITGGTKTGTAVSVSASELVSGTLSVTENGTVNVTNYASASVNVPTSNDFVVTLTYNDTTEMWEPDCTFAEAYAAYQAGKNMVAKAGDYNGASIAYDADDTGGFLYVVFEQFDEYNGTQYYNWGVRYPVYIWTADGVELDGGEVTYNTQPATAVPSDVAQGKYFYNANGIQVGTASGGASNIVQGTFTVADNPGGVQAVTIPYNGTGYPIAYTVYPVGGFYGNTELYNLLQRYAIVQLSGVKSNISIAPTYQENGTTQDVNGAHVSLMYKNSTTNAILLDFTGGTSTAFRGNDNAYATVPNQIAFKNATTMNIFIASTSYGFAAGIEYAYTIVYSE